MASDFKIGLAVESLTALDELTVPVLNPQWEFAQYRKKVKLGDLSMLGMGPQIIPWRFPMLETDMLEQLMEFSIDEPIYIRTCKRNLSYGVYEVIFSVQDPREDGDHVPYMPGQRANFNIEFIVLSEVA